MECLDLGPCQDPEISKTDSACSKVHGYGVLGTMSGPYLNHFWPSFTFRPAIALKFIRLSQHDVRPMSINRLFLETMSGPC